MRRTALLFGVLTVLLAAADRPHTSQRETGKLVEIPASAIRVQLEHVEQPDGISCGAAAMMSVCAYYGVGPRTIQDFKKHLHTDHNGTSYKNLLRYAGELGLVARLEHATTPEKMTPDRLEHYLKDGKPVICCIQA